MNIHSEFILDVAHFFSYSVTDMLMFFWYSILNRNLQFCCNRAFIHLVILKC